MIKRSVCAKRAGIFLIFLLLFFVGHIGMRTEAAEKSDTDKETGRVLFISSYSYAWETVPQQIEGIREALGEEVTLDYQFMDTKNVDTEESKQLFYEHMKYYLGMVPAYDVVIVGDDAAFNFAIEYKEELFPQIPIVFEGVNNVENAVTASEDPYVTGVIESLSYGNTIALASRMYPEATRVVGILDDTVTGVGERAEFYKYAEEFPNLEFEEINASQLSQEELKSAVAALGGESILIYIMCSQDADGNTYASAEAVTMLSEAAKIPTFSIVSIGMGKGFLGGEIVSQKQMGVIAGDMAAQILAGTDCAEIGFVGDSPKTYWFDENVMNRFGIKHSMLPSGAEIINHKETFLERNRAFIRIVLLVLLFLLLLIALLAADNMRKRKINGIISRANRKLEYTARYDALTQLLNRRVFMEDLQKKIDKGEAFGIIMYDLDNFKRINDKYGHNMGDLVLKELASRSAAIADAVFTPYRLAGDEFIVIVSAEDKAILEKYARKLRDALQEPYQLNDAKEQLGTSIGVALWPKDGTDGTALIAAADQAMYYIKNHGKNGIAFYEAGKIC